jgi:PAS domain S-box-containing protein
LLAAALGPRKPAAPAAPVHPEIKDSTQAATNDVQIDLLAGLNAAGQAAGISAWDWNIEAGTFRYNREELSQSGGESAAAHADLGTWVELAVFRDDQVRFREEMIKALKGAAPLCIDYRVVRIDGSVRPVQLRGEVFRGTNGRATHVVGFTIDMTRQVELAARGAADATKQRRLFERLSLATEAAGIGVWDWDLVSGKLSADTNMAGIFSDADFGGITRGDEFVRRILHPDDRDAFLETMRSAVGRSGAERVSINFRYLRKDGGVQHVELHGRILRDAEGRAVNLLCVSWNITAKVEAQAQLQQQSEAQRVLLERLHLATEVASLDVWDWDLVGDRIVADAFLTDAYTTNHFDSGNARKAVASLLHPEDTQGYFEALDRAIASGATFFHRYRILLANGTQRHVQTNARIFRDAHGRAIRLLGVSQNVTEEMKHLNELRRQTDEERVLRERLNLATKTAGIAIWDKDLVRGDFVCDEQFWKMFGLVPNSRFKVHDGIHPDEREKALEPLNVAFADPKQVEILSVRHRSNNPRPERQYVQTHMRVFRNTDGRAIRLLGVTWDVTAEELHNEELQRTADKERALLERLNVTTKAAGISPWEFDLKSNELTWLGVRPVAYGFGDIATADFMKALEKIVLPEDLHFLSSAAANAIANDTPDYTYQFRVNGFDGKIHHMRNICRVMKNERGKYRYVMGVTLDVTNEVESNALLEQRAEEKRRQAETERMLVNRLNVATQAAGISPWEYDLIADQFSWIGTPLKILGLDNSRPENYLEEITQIVVPEDRGLLRQATLDALEHGVEVFSYIYRAKGTDGQIHHLKNFARVLRSERGTPYRLVGVTWDVSDEVAANEQLKQQAEHERQLIARLNIATDSAGISSWEMDLVASRFLWIENPIKSLWRESDMSDDEHSKSTLFVERMFVEDRNSMRNAIGKALAEKTDRINYIYRARANDGSTVHVQSFARLILDDKKRVVRILGVSWDITREAIAKERLEQQARYEREMLERLNVATQGAGISMWEWDLKANRNTWLSKRLAILGLDDVPAEAYSMELRKIMHPEDRCLIDDVPREAIVSGKETYSYRFRVNGIDGKLHHLQNYVRVLRSPRGNAYRLVGVTWDVTQVVAATEQLAEQAQKERALTERLSVATQSAGISTWELDLVSAKFLWVENPLTATAAARAENPNLGHFADRMHPDDRKLMSTEIKKAAKEGHDIIRYCYRLYRPDNSLAYIQTYAKLYFNDQRRAIRALGVSWDITKDFEAAEKLSNAERRLERASLSSSEGHWEAELATGNLWCSSSFHTLLGFRTGELEARITTLEALINPEDRRTYDTALKAHLSNNAPYDVELRLRMSSGEYRWFHMRGAADRGPDGSPTVIAGSIHDVHQQKQVEDALKLAQLRFERAINGTQDGLWELDIASDLVWCSPRLALLLGYTAAQLAAKNFLRSLIHADDAAKLANVSLRHYRDNAPFDLEVRLQTLGGEYRWYRARATAERDAAGRALKLSGSLQDVTEARAAREELMRATEAAEAASRAKSAFLANVSHEIRTPMNGIVGMTGLILDTQLDRTQRDYADTIRASADSLLRVINDILDFSKIEAGKLDLENIELDLRANVEDVAAMMAFQAANKGLELIVNVHPEVPERVKGDPQRLRQCLINLVGNAIKFTRTGEIVVDVCAVGRHNGRVLTHFEVRDTGLGIAQETLKTLFQPFVQADSSTTRHYGGTGLGLSIVRRLVELMGGQVGVVSELDKGSAFFFTLSLEPAFGTSATEAPRDRKTRGRILVVDDNATNRRVLNLQLVHAGYRTTLAASGADALTRLHEAAQNDQLFDMVITDFQMPDMDGEMLAARIVDEPKFSNTRLVMLTSLDKQGDTKRLAALGFAAYLTKPVRARELLICVERVLAGEARQWQMEVRPMITRSTLSLSDPEHRFQGRVLLVEDNAINQKVAVRFLERLGCSIRVADHGEAGVAAFLEERFDVILMDLQMPVMDGLSATRRIRDLEGADRRRGRTPIVALTANAMRGDQERCEAAGMDGYLTKPIEVDRLRDTLEKFGMNATVMKQGTDELQANALGPNPAPGGDESADPPVELARLNAVADGDPEFLAELIAIFVASGAEQLAELGAALSAADRTALARTAHKLKGGCGNIHARAMHRLAHELETSAGSADAARLAELYDRLTIEFERARQFLNDPSISPKQIKAAS